MRVTCLCVCHNKPDLTHEAVESVFNQSYPNWELIVIDSGVLYDSGYYERYSWHTDTRFRCVRSNENEALRRTHAMAPWCFNECYRRDLVRGDLVVYLCDDDILYPQAFQTFVGTFLDHPEFQAVYASLDLGVIFSNGWRCLTGERRATVPGGQLCHGRRMDGEVDYLQICHRRNALHGWPSDTYWPEAKCTENHADGVFMENLGKRCVIHPIDVKVAQNRRTLQSINISIGPLMLLDSLVNGVPLGLTAAPSSVSASTSPDSSVTIFLTPPTHPEVASRIFNALASQTYNSVQLRILASETSLTWQQLLDETSSSYCLFLSGDSIPLPHSVERLVTILEKRPLLGAVTAYLAAHSGNPCSPPQLSLKNLHPVFLARTDKLRQVGDWRITAQLSHCWQILVRLVNHGVPIDLVPEHLFWYNLPEGVGDDLRPFLAAEQLAAEERVFLWQSLQECQQRLVALQQLSEAQRERLTCLRYRLADWFHGLVRGHTTLLRGLKRLVAPTSL